MWKKGSNPNGLQQEDLTLQVVRVSYYHMKDRTIAVLKAFPVESIMDYLTQW